MFCYIFFFLMIRRPPRSTLSSSSAASDVYKRQVSFFWGKELNMNLTPFVAGCLFATVLLTHSILVSGSSTWLSGAKLMVALSLIHISEPTRLLSISYAVFCLKKKK
eukprot:TRINITY_DN37526_c0_g1_i1.p2 TRINITY_DN37526_c0_g1~~TRINITY_DN37526_c0_g1_i1.p2  ORF type:complete len:107 (+),score=38.54 TRINITY_DN37526_c0_g1_i1:37-357(+)